MTKTRARRGRDARIAAVRELETFDRAWGLAPRGSIVTAPAAGFTNDQCTMAPHVRGTLPRPRPEPVWINPLVVLDYVPADTDALRAAYYRDYGRYRPAGEDDDTT